MEMDGGFSFLFCVGLLGLVFGLGREEERSVEF